MRHIRSFSCAAVSITLLTLSSPIYAGLTGDSVTGLIENFYVPGGNGFPNGTATVGSGIEFGFNGDYIDETYGLIYTWRITTDITDSQIRLRQYVDIPFVAGIGGTTYTISWRAWIGDLNWQSSPNAPLIAKVVSSNAIDLVGFSGHQLEAYIPGLQFYFGINGPRYIDQTLVVDLIPVPEPAQSNYIVIGLLAIAGRILLSRNSRPFGRRSTSRSCTH